MRILFVCTGNTCRSPMAAGIARAVAAERGLTDVTVESAGAGANPYPPGVPMPEIGASDGALLVDYAGLGLRVEDLDLLIPSDDVLLAGDDVVTAGPGNDYLRGYAGNDRRLTLAVTPPA